MGLKVTLGGGRYSCKIANWTRAGIYSRCRSRISLGGVLIKGSELRDWSNLNWEKDVKKCLQKNSQRSFSQNTSNNKKKLLEQLIHFVSLCVTLWERRQLCYTLKASFSADGQGCSNKVLIVTLWPSLTHKGCLTSLPSPLQGQTRDVCNFGLIYLPIHILPTMKTCFSYMTLETQKATLSLT